MANPVLFRFDTTLYRDKASGDPTQVPFAGAKVDFYFQGATVISSVGSIPPSASAGVSVYNPGSLKASDIVSIGVGGARITVDSVGTTPPPYPGPVFLTVRNTSGQTVSIPAGTRLLIVGRRPNVYGDPVGTVPLLPTLPADSTGRVSVYIAEQRFDYSVIRPAEVLLTSSATLFSGTEIGWDHPGSAGQNCVLIGVSWVAASEDTVADLASVSYGGVNIPVASALVRGGSSAIFRLLNPPSGIQAVLISFTNPPVHAVGGAISLANVSATLGATASGYASSMAASVTINAASYAGRAFDVLSLTPSSSPPTASPALPGQVQQWNDGTGAGFFFLQGAGSTRPLTQPPISSEMRWTLGASAPWELVAAEILSAVPSPLLFPDAEGGTHPNPSWLNLRDFASLAEAVAALPNYGGEIFIPTGVYFVVSPGGGLPGVTINKPNVTLRGEGTSSILRAVQPTPGVNPGYHLITVGSGAHRFRLCNLVLDGNASGPGVGAGLVLDTDTQNTITLSRLENVHIQKTAGYGLSLRNILGFHATALEVDACFDHGISLVTNVRVFFLFGSSGNRVGDSMRRKRARRRSLCVLSPSCLRPGPSCLTPANVNGLP